MSKKQDKIDITNIIISAAAKYKAEMVGKTFLYVFEGRHIEVVYRVKDFLHLTGAATSLSATDFYKEATQGTLRHNQIYFTPRHPFDLCIKKIAYLEQISSVTDSDMLIMEDVSTDTATYKFGVTDLAFILCLDKDPNSTMYTTRSLRADDGFGRSGGAFEVNAIFCKPNNTKLYDCCTFDDGKCLRNDLPEEVKAKLSTTLL